jgi:serine/threonine protein kinase
MHSLNIIHGDIKLANIMWSETYQKNIFIDFGLSMFLK